MTFDLTGKKLLVLGHNGLVGRALMRRLNRSSAAMHDPMRNDLRSQRGVETLFSALRPDVVFLAAATVGGILANSTRPAEFIYDNLAIQTNVIEAARRWDVAKLVMISSSCIYPRTAPQPILETDLLTGPLEPTNQAYAVAKIAGIEMARAYRKQYGFDVVTGMGPNIYGEDDHYGGLGNHVMAAMIRRIVTAKREGAKSITIWGTGRPIREFLHADDFADALVFLAENYQDDEPINIGPGVGVAISDLATMVAHAVDWSGQIETDPAMPDGTPCKVMDVSRMQHLGWWPKITLHDGIRRAVDRYQAKH